MIHKNTMRIYIYSLLLHYLLYFLFLSLNYAQKKAYIVYLGEHSHGPRSTVNDFERAKESHQEFLKSHIDSKEMVKERLIYSYGRHINGFAAMLEEEEAISIAKNPDVISIFLSKNLRPQTTHSWNFLKLDANDVSPYNAWKKARFGNDTIIGSVDCGVWPESESFVDENMGPVPSRWRGICQQANEGVEVPCNRKLIGVRFYNQGYFAGGKTPNGTSDPNARDVDGHGTHTLSTAGGNFVPGASIFGYAYGNASGGAPAARLAAYKACWTPYGLYCTEIDLLAAIDAAIYDGVDVLFAALSSDQSRPYFESAIAIGAFHAVKNNITMVAAGGNDGPSPSTVGNAAPWILTVGATTMDREFTSNVVVATNDSQNFKKLQFKGISLSTERLPFNKYYPLITGRAAKDPGASDHDAMACLNGTLRMEKAKGRIVLCVAGDASYSETGHQVALAGAVGMILVTHQPSSNQIEATAYTLPASGLTYSDGKTLLAYVNCTENPMAYIGPVKTKLRTRPAPVMAFFSSRGPNQITSGILKPDIVAPGFNILATFTGVNSPTYEDWDNRRTNFTLMSGTSMACAHIAGVVALVKTLHPDWSPAAIYSAIITTATTLDNTLRPILDYNSSLPATPFDYGAGLVQPDHAVDPGLVYDLTTNDYLNFLCSQGYNQTLIKLFFQGLHKCPDNFNLRDFNYPSITVHDLNVSATVTRTLKNVGPPSTYSVHVHEPIGISMHVIPNKLKFEKTGEERNFKLTMSTTKEFHDTNKFVFGELVWGNGQHSVKSPIAVKGI